MHHYIFQGRVLPERAQLSFQTPEFKIQTNGRPDLLLSANILLNQVAVFVTTDDQDIFTLRNFIQEFVGAQLAVLGFTHGHAYDIEITRVLTHNRAVDVVFGIEIPCIAENQDKRNPALTPEALGMLTIENNGQYLRRFFTDFTLAMKHAMDTAFYCYRALEALRQHCAATEDSSAINANKTLQWEKFRNATKASRDEFDHIRIAAEGVRHGGVQDISDEQRQHLFKATWSIAERYFQFVLQNKSA